MAPSSGLRLVQGFTSASLEAAARARLSPHAVRAFNALTTAGRRHHAPGTQHQLPRGNPSPPLRGTVRHGRCQPRDAALPTLVRLTHRALEGGPATPSNCFLVTLQGQAMTLSWRDAIPATVGPAQPPPCTQHHATHCCDRSGAAGRTGKGRRHACHCTPYGSTSATTSSPPEDATVNHYTPTLEAATVRVQDTP
jgi:hypothetical protein